MLSPAGFQTIQILSPLSQPFLFSILIWSPQCPKLKCLRKVIRVSSIEGVSYFTSHLSILNDVCRGDGNIKPHT